MSTSKPMSDGGKGSVRRNEDTEAYRNNFDAIFRKDKKLMERDPYEEEDEPTCDSCGGPMYRQAHWSYMQCDDCGARQELEEDDNYE